MEFGLYSNCRTLKKQHKDSVKQILQLFIETTDVNSTKKQLMSAFSPYLTERVKKKAKSFEFY